MPSGTKAAFLDSMKTTSFHMNDISYCKQSKKGPSTVKFIVFKDGSNKSYDFEAESADLAGEVAIGSMILFWTDVHYSGDRRYCEGIEKQIFA